MIAVLLCGAALLCGPAALPSGPAALRSSTTVGPAAEDQRSRSVGVPGRIDGVVYEGPLLVVRKMAVDSPLVLRIVDVWPHGSARRYDFEYYGLEPGEYALQDSLQAEDGGPVSGLDLPVRIDSLLPPGQVEPHALEVESAGALGGYRTLLIAGGVVWVVVGVLLFTLGRRRRLAAATPEGQAAQTLAQRLRPLVEQAVAGTLEPARRAELEMSLLAYWRRRLNAEDTEPTALLRQLAAHDEAGPLLRGLEDWLHRPGPAQDVDVEALLRPYETVQDLELSTPEGADPAAHGPGSPRSSGSSRGLGV